MDKGKRKETNNTQTNEILVKSARYDCSGEEVDRIRKECKLSGRREVSMMVFPIFRTPIRFLERSKVTYL